MPVETAGGQSPLVVGLAEEGFQLALPPVPNEAPPSVTLCRAPWGQRPAVGTSPKPAIL